MTSLGHPMMLQQLSIGKLRWSTYSLYKHVIPYNLIFSSKKNISWPVHVQLSPFFHQMMHNGCLHHILRDYKQKKILVSLYVQKLIFWPFQNHLKLNNFWQHVQLSPYLDQYVSGDEGFPTRYGTPPNLITGENIDCFNQVVRKYTGRSVVIIVLVVLFICVHAPVLSHTGYSIPVPWYKKIRARRACAPTKYVHLRSTMRLH